MEKTVCCWLCTSGPISITARTDRKGYCPGRYYTKTCLWAYVDRMSGSAYTTVQSDQGLPCQLAKPWDTTESKLFVLSLYGPVNPV